MKPQHMYGEADGETVYPVLESFRYRAMALIGKRELRLCEICLRNKRRCAESRSGTPRNRSWKRHRKTQYRARVTHP